MARLPDRVAASARAGRSNRSARQAASMAGTASPGMTPVAASARASAASKSSIDCSVARSSQTARMAALDSSGASRGDRAVLMGADPNHARCSLPIPNHGRAALRTHRIHPSGRLSFAPPVLYLGTGVDTGSIISGEFPMAMTMSGEVQLAAPRDVVWEKLNDPAVLKACIPGCEELETTEEGGFRASAKIKVGPVSARFKGKVTL